MPWMAEDAEPNADMWATAQESTEHILALYDRAWEVAEDAIDELALDSPGRVPWWGDQGDVTLHRLLVHVVAEVARHAGHADILRELADGQAGIRKGLTNLPDEDEQWWADRVALDQPRHLVAAQDACHRPCRYPDLGPIQSGPLRCSRRSARTCCSTTVGVL